MEGLYYHERDRNKDEAKKKPKFIGGAERARRQARRKDWEPPSRRRQREEREQQAKTKNKKNKKNNNVFFHGAAIPLSTSKLRSSERFFAALLNPSNFPEFNTGFDHKHKGSNHHDHTVLQTICLKLGLGLPPSLRTNQSGAQGIPHTDDLRSFFSSRATLVMEESRYELAEALRKHYSKSILGNGNTDKYQRKRSRQQQDDSSSWTTVNLKDAQEQNRTGFLLLELEKKSGRFSIEELNQQRPGSCFEIKATIQQTHDDDDDAKSGTRSHRKTILQTIGSVGPGKRGTTKLVLVLYDGGSIARLTTSLKCQQSHVALQIRFCTTLISQCRQFEACDFGNSRHFKKGNNSKGLLKKIMGQKQATHIRFEYSDDDQSQQETAKEVSSDEEGSEAIVGFIIDDDGTEHFHGDDCYTFEGKPDGDFDREEVENENPNEPRDGYTGNKKKDYQSSRLHLSMASFTGLTALNSTQETAASEFCDYDDGKKDVLQLVQGPPGTGKTTFVVSVLARLLCSSNKRKRILVTAPTNKAVGVIAKRFLEACPGILEDHGIPVALIGVEDKLLETSSRSNHTPVTSGISRRPTESAATEDAPETNTSSSFADAQLKRIFCYTWITSLLEDYKHLTEKLEISIAQRSSTQAVRSAKNSPAEDRGLSVWLPRALPPSYASSYDLMANSDSDTDTEGGNDEEDNVEPVSEQAMCTTQHSLLQKARGLHARLVRNLPRLSESSGAAKLSRNLIECLKDGPNKNHSEACFFLRELLKLLTDDGASSNNGLAHDSDNDDRGGSLETNAVPELLATARIIFCTLSTAGTSLMKQTRRVDDWIVDEAAASTEAELLIPLHLDPKRLLAVGDPMQLPASVASPWAVQWGLGRSLHERLTIDLGHSQTMLDVQYRMRPEISAFPSKQFYEGKLTNGDNVQSDNYGTWNDIIHEQKHQVLQTTPAWSFFQVDGNERQSGSGSYYNIEEASAAVGFLKMLRKISSYKENVPKSKVYAWCSPEKVRIITFYSAQVAMLKQMLRREGMPHVLVATVDSSQGCEADIIILSFVRTSRAGFLADDRRMNVALTRAKHKLICLGNVQDSFWAAPGSSSETTLTKMVKDAQERNCISYALSSTHIRSSERK